jgi:hypothetical protein
VQDAQNQNADTASHSVEEAMNPPANENADENKPKARVRKRRGEN